MCSCNSVLVRENPPWNESAEEGDGGVIKLKRLGEEELQRIYDRRHWLHNPNPVQSAPKERLAVRMQNWVECMLRLCRTRSLIIRIL